MVLSCVLKGQILTPAGTVLCGPQQQVACTGRGPGLGEEVVATAARGVAVWQDEGLRTVLACLHDASVAEAEAH